MPRASELRDQGSALVVGLFFTILVSGIVMTGSMVLEGHRRKTETNFRANGQATQFARSGITEAMTWFRRQTSQPVTLFDPRVDLESDPPIVDSTDPDIGIVREFRIQGKMFGRYEVWKEWTDDPVLMRRSWRDRMAARDISGIRGMGAEGSGWRIRSLGYVFIRNSDTARFDDSPNTVIANQALEGEILRMKLSPPGQAALSVAAGRDAILETNSRIYGGADGAGIFYPSGTGTPNAVAGLVQGTPPLAPSTSYAGDVRSVFGVRPLELKGLADHTITDPDDFPTPVPLHSLVYVETPSIEFTAERPLRGNGVIYVKGDVAILPGSNSAFSGLLYVDGNLGMFSPAEIHGAVIVTRQVVARGLGDYATIRFDDAILNVLRREVGQYRFLGAIRTARSSR